MARKAKSLFFPVLLTCFVITIASYDLVTRAESYPMAAYTMYSYPYAWSSYEQFDIRFYNRLEEVKYYHDLIFPWDEARLNAYLKTLYENNQQATIDAVLTEIVHKNRTKKYSRIEFTLRRWERLTVENLSRPDESKLIGRAEF